MSTDITVRSSEKSIQEHLRRSYTALFSGQEIYLSTLYDTYRSLRPSLHRDLLHPKMDISTLGYSLARLPDCIFKTKKVILAQSPDQLSVLGLDIAGWQLQGAPGRRRRNYFNHVTGTLVILLSSDSDIDDCLNCLIAYQLESQKFSDLSNSVFSSLINEEKFSAVGLTDDEWQKLKTAFGVDWHEHLLKFHQYSDLIIQSFPRQEALYTANAQSWLQKVATTSLVLGLYQSPVYLVSSNLHSLVNVIAGYVNLRQDFIINHTEKNYPDLYNRWLEFKSGLNPLRVIDFLYYISGKYFRDNPAEAEAKKQFEANLGIRQIITNHQYPSDVQIIPVASLASAQYRDPNLKITNPDRVSRSPSLIINIDYPLGFAAYYMFRELLLQATALKGLYVIGKAAILAGKVGDIQIPSTVFDERTNNIFQIDNVFNRITIPEAFVSAVLSRQKAISVYGTFLENETQLQNYTSTNFNIIEMESGPYLTAIHQHQSGLAVMPQNTVTPIANTPFDLGIINYASDNPLSQNLGDATMSLQGIEPTYLAALSVVQRILDLESA